MMTETTTNSVELAEGPARLGSVLEQPQQASDVAQAVHDHIASVYAENWTNCNANLTTNIFASDRFNCGVLAHADLSRTKGESLGPRLDRINWGLRPRRDRRSPTTSATTKQYELEQQR